MFTIASPSQRRLLMILLLPFILVACDGGDGADTVSTPSETSALTNPPDNQPTSSGSTITTAPEMSTSGPPSIAGPSLPTASNEVLIGAAFANPPSYSFGQVAVGHIVTRALGVSAIGNTTEVVRKVVVTGAAFSIADDGCTGARLPCVVRVTATPPTPAEHHGSINVTTSTGRSGWSDLVVGER
jgi:hypothetical protein